MSINFNQIAQFSVAIGAALLNTMAANLAPAQAGQLKFNFNTDNGGTGSFNLNTSAIDLNPNSGEGAYIDAITNFIFNGSLLSLDTVLVTQYNPGDNTSYWASVGSSSPQHLTFLGFGNTNGSLVDELSSNPSDYNFWLGGFAVETVNGGNFMNITGLTVMDSTSVPEPAANFAFLALGALGAASLKKRQVKKQASLRA